MLDLTLRKKTKLASPEAIDKRERKEVEQEMFTKCPGCELTLKTKKIEKNLYTCDECGYHFKMPVKVRIEETVSKFKPLFENYASVNPLNFDGYDQKIKNYKKNSGNTEAVTVGTAKIGRVHSVVAVMDPFFMMGSMGSVVGERITSAFEYATKNKMPIVIFTASGGARMQEGLFSLMQMAKTSAAAKRHSDAGLFYLTVLTNPTTGGVTASFAMLGDIHIAEPGALVGFAGPRVIAQTTRQTLPDGFQTAEFVKEHGFIDLIVERKNMRKIIERLVAIHNKG